MQGSGGEAAAAGLLLLSRCLRLLPRNSLRVCPASHARLLKTVEILEGIKENPKVGQSLIPPANPRGRLCSPRQHPLHPGAGS